MIQPESLRPEEYQPRSRGRGVDVWAMLCASIMGDLDTISTLVARDLALVECEPGNRSLHDSAEPKKTSAPFGLRKSYGRRPRGETRNQAFQDAGSDRCVSRGRQD
jgi:hypothetical protein